MVLAVRFLNLLTWHHFPQGVRRRLQLTRHGDNLVGANASKRLLILPYNSGRGDIRQTLCYTACENGFWKPTSNWHEEAWLSTLSAMPAGSRARRDWWSSSLAVSLMSR